jgi:hypothetical protein
MDSNNVFQKMKDVETNPQQPQAPQSTPAPHSAQPQPQSVFEQMAQQEQQQAAIQQPNDPRKSGEIVNDVGNTVIVPKDGESFSDTVKRAVAHQKSLTPEQQQAAIDKEVATMPAKTAQTLGAAATIGAVGPALLAAPGEIAEAVPSVVTHTIDGVKAIGSWAGKNPVQAYLLFQVLKELVPGAKKAMGIVKGVPDVE